MHAVQKPGMGTRLRPEVKERRDATVVVSDEPQWSAIDHWHPYAVRGEATEAEVQRLKKDRGFSPQENELFDRLGWPRLRLGPHLLRAETAAVVGGAMLVARSEGR